MKQDQLDQLVSIIIVTFNHERFIGQAVESACSQTYANTEIIVIDDASNDRTQELVRSLQARCAFTFIRNESNEGNINANLLKALEHCRGRYVCFLDGDDFFSNNKVEHQLNLLVSRNLDFIVSNMFMVDGVGNTIGEVTTRSRLETLNRLTSQKRLDLYAKWAGFNMIRSGLFRTEAVRQCSYAWRECLLDDVPMLFALLYHGYKGYFDPDPSSYFYRIHESNWSLDPWKPLTRHVSALAVFPQEYRIKVLSGIIKSLVFRLLLSRNNRLFDILKLSIVRFALAPGTDTFRWIFQALGVGFLSKFPGLISLLPRFIRRNKMIVMIEKSISATGNVDR